MIYCFIKAIYHKALLLSTPKMRQNIIDDVEHMCYSSIVYFCFEREAMELEMSQDVLDLPPEYCHYRDEGCDLAGSCLNCPLPRCIYDQGGGKQRWLKKSRDREITRLAVTDGKGVKELATIFRISQRTVQRALKRVKNE